MACCVNSQLLCSCHHDDRIGKDDAKVVFRVLLRGEEHGKGHIFTLFLLNFCGLKSAKDANVLTRFLGLNTH